MSVDIKNALPLMASWNRGKVGISCKLAIDGKSLSRLEVSNCITQRLSILGVWYLYFHAVDVPLLCAQEPYLYKFVWHIRHCQGYKGSFLLYVGVQEWYREGL